MMAEKKEGNSDVKMAAYSAPIQVMPLDGTLGARTAMKTAAQKAEKKAV